MDQVYVARHKVLVEGLSVRQVARQMGVSRNAVRRYVEGAEPSVRKAVARSRPVSDGVRPRLEALLDEAPRWTGGKQRLTAARLHQMLVAEGHGVSERTVRSCLAEWKRRRQEVFVPLTYKPGDLAEVDFFEVLVEVGGSAKKDSAEWYAAMCLAGEAGLRVGEVRALKWENVDLVAGTLTVAEQSRHGITGTPKGGRRRVVPMTATLLSALKALPVVRVGYVVRNLDGTAMTDGQTQWAMSRILRRAGLAPRGWHALRHAFGTHAALLGVNPWRLQAWMGHARIDETMIYVHSRARTIDRCHPSCREAR